MIKDEYSAIAIGTVDGDEENPIMLMTIGDLSSLVEYESWFIFVMGATGSGKNFIVSEYLPKLPLVDIDKYMAELSLADPDGKDERKIISKAVHMAKKQLDVYFNKGKSVIQTGTGGNIKGLENKIKLAKSKGLKTALILVDTDIEKAKQRNQSRAESGKQRLVPQWKVEDSYKKSAENFQKLEKSVDFATIIKN